jgi:hypothetical protein
MVSEITQQWLPDSDMDQAMVWYLEASQLLRTGTIQFSSQSFLV